MNLSHPVRARAARRSPAMPVPETGLAGRIAILLHDFPLGGTERVIIGLANRWAAGGRAVTILCGTEAGPARALVAPDVAVRAMAPVIPRGGGSRRRLGRAFAREIGAGEFDAVISPGNFHLPVLGSVARHCDCARIALISKLSNPLARPDRSWLRQRLFDFATRRVARHVDGFVALADSLRDEAAARLGPSRILTIRDPLFTEPLVRPAVTGGPPTILCAGRLVPQKRFDLALRAFAAMPLADARLVVLGDGPDRAALEALAGKLHIDGRVRFVGYVGDIRPWLAEADMLLSTSVFEGYPAVLVEALAAGVPVVATPSSPAIAEILPDPRLGIIAEATPAALAAALTRGLTGDPPPAALRIAFAERHDAERQAAAWLALIDRVTAGKRRRHAPSL